MCETLLTNLRKSIVDESNDVIDMLQLDSNNSFLLSDLDSNIEKQTH